VASSYQSRSSKIAEAYYNAIMKGMDYVEQGVSNYMEQLKKR
jgi:hypothetical protein